jgi:signal transduction histidine kinase
VQNRIKILLIDDEEVILDSCTQILHGSPYDVSTAADGTRGLELAEELRPDLVVVDLKMPGLSGFDVLERIQAVDPTIVAIVITGYATVSSAVEAMKKGAYDFLPKPFTPDEFRLIIRRAVEKRLLTLETTALRRERELLRENFAAIVSHELKAPLGAMQQNLFVLAHELSATATEDQQRRLDRMKSRVDDLVKLIHSWLRGISVDIESIKDEFAPVPIAVPISKAIENTEPHAVRKDIEVVSSAPDRELVVHGDEGTLTEALTNLLGNAVKYSHTGGTVSIVAERDGDRVKIRVTDSGVGIAAEDLPFIFDGFYRAESGKAAGKGSGIGLAVSRRIIEAHDGSIDVQSDLGQGSTFLIALPAGSEVPTGGQDAVASTNNSPKGSAG